MDVEWTEDQKFPHVADRLGYPCFAETPFEKIIGVERSLAHPNYQFQPFVQTPSMAPDPTLNFELGETVYENKRIGEWVRLWKWSMFVTLPFLPMFYIFEIYHADGVPSMQWLGAVNPLPRHQFSLQDQGGWGLEGIRYCDDHDYMNMQYAIKRSVVRPYHTFYQLGVLLFIHNLSADYVTKIQYNKDKDLVFVSRPDGVFRDTESVYEVHHLEQMVPSPVLALKDIGKGQKDGITSMHCMSTGDYLKVYNEDKYWNLENREEFMAETRSLWNDLSTKYNGRIFTLETSPDSGDQEAFKRINQELVDAVAKHGEARPYDENKDAWEADMRKARESLANAL